MTWIVLDRPAAIYDFEDWRAAEDTDIQNEENLDPDSVFYLPSRRHNKVAQIRKGAIYEYYWESAEHYVPLWGASDDEAMEADEWARQLAQQGNPEALGFLAATRIQLGKHIEASRWLQRLNFIMTPGASHPLPASEDPEDYWSYVQSKFEEHKNAFEEATGTKFSGGFLKDVGPAAETNYCESCGVKLVDGLRWARCSGFYFDLLFDAIDQPNDLPGLLETHDLELLDGRPSVLGRWPGGLPKKVDPSVGETERKVAWTNILGLDHLFEEADTAPSGASKQDPVTPTGLTKSSNGLGLAPTPAAAPKVGPAKFCSSCGTAITNDEAKFCSGCGAARS